MFEYVCCENLPCCLLVVYSFYSFHLHFQTAGRYRISHKCPNPSFCQSRTQKQRSHHTTSPLSSALALLVIEVHWASLEWSETQPQHNCQVHGSPFWTRSLILKRMSTDTRSLFLMLNTPVVHEHTKYNSHSTTKVVNAMLMVVICFSVALQ